MNQARRRYPSDMTNQQWEAIRGLIPPARSGGRPRTTQMREIINAVFYITRSGCAWRYLPRDYPPWQTVYTYFRRWLRDGTWQKLHFKIAKAVRRSDGRKAAPSMVIIDAQSVRAQYGEERGFDGFKKVRGRKREIIVDTMGIIWAAKVHAANEGENRKGFAAVEKYPFKKRPEKLLGDYSYSRTPFSTQLKEKWKIEPDVKKAEISYERDKFGSLQQKVRTTNLGAKRWVVERTFAWFNNYRRLNRDYERRVVISETFLFISQIQLLLSREL